MSRRSRPGNTEKLSISLDEEAVAVLRRRAQRLHAGNLSAAVAEGVRRLEEEEGREALVRWLGAAGEASEAERRAIVGEWGRPKRSRRVA